MFLNINEKTFIGQKLCDLLFSKQTCYLYKLQSKDFGLFNNDLVLNHHLCNYTIFDVNNAYALMGGSVLMGYMLYEAFNKNDYLSNIIKR